MKRSGIVIRFDICPALRELTDAEVGQLFRALLEYGQTGVLPGFQDRTLRTVWRQLQARADQDAAKYSKKCLDSRFAVYCREAEKKGQIPLPRDEWVQLQPQDPD